MAAVVPGHSASAECCQHHASCQNVNIDLYGTGQRAKKTHKLRHKEKTATNQSVLQGELIQNGKEELPKWRLGYTVHAPIVPCTALLDTYVEQMYMNYEDARACDRADSISRTELNYSHASMHAP